MLKVVKSEVVTHPHPRDGMDFPLFSLMVLMIPLLRIVVNRIYSYQDDIGLCGRPLLIIYYWYLLPTTVGLFTAGGGVMRQGGGRVGERHQFTCAEQLTATTID